MREVVRKEKLKLWPNMENRKDNKLGLTNIKHNKAAQKRIEGRVEKCEETSSNLSFSKHTENMKPDKECGQGNKVN